MKFDNKCKYENGEVTYVRVLNGVNYSDMFRTKTYRNGVRYNSFCSSLSSVKDCSGVYIIVQSNDKAFYVGEAHNRPLYYRIQQHFSDKKNGGIRFNLSKNERIELDNSVIFAYECICNNNETHIIGKTEILCAESFFINNLNQ